VPLRAEEEAPESAVISKTIALPGYRVGPAPVGPRLSLPTDLMPETGQRSDSSMWRLEEVFPDGTWLPFDEAQVEDSALSLDSAVELLSQLSANHKLAEPTVDLSATERGIVIEGTPANVAAAEARWPWVLEALAPSLEVSAVLHAGGSGEQERLRAMGRVRLWPDRWTRVYLQEDAVPCVVALHLEVAQESTVIDPYPADVAEGEELYLRYHPGQGVAVVEMWSGVTEHLSIIREDLSEIRNIPEASSPGVLTYPETAVSRAFTAFLLPSGEPARREVRWTDGARSLRLALTFGAPPRAQEPAALGERRGLASLRVGAVGRDLEFGSRPGVTGEWEERLSRMLYQTGAAYESRGQRFEFSVSSVGAGSILFVEAPLADVARAHASVEEAEQLLHEKTVDLSLLTVPEPAFRAALRSGVIGLGRALPEAVRTGFLESGASVGASLSVPVLSDMRAGFRIGRTVPGVVDFDAEIAQASGGLYPQTSARFAGVLGEVVVGARADGYALRVQGALSWADRGAGQIEMLFRPPVSMRGTGTDVPASQREPYRVKIPVLGGGQVPFDAEVVLPGRGALPHLMHAQVRGQEVVLLVVTLR
jgi:hypothetical protein